MSVAPAEVLCPETDGVPSPTEGALTFDGVYAEQFSFVWRNLRRLGVEERSLDDAAQDVFLVVHRRLGEYEGRSSLRAWIFGILRRVAHDYRRSRSRERARIVTESDHVDTAAAPVEMADPCRTIETNHELRAALMMLSEVLPSRREMLMLVDLEQMTVPEAATAVGINTSTAYSRLRQGRLDFDAVALRHAAKRRTRP